MRDNYNIAIRGNRVMLVPYQRRFVAKYNHWMQDPELQAMTASEPLTLQQEYDMQRAWREDADKCTFIVLSNATRQYDACLGADNAAAADDVSSMVGDVNLFFNNREDRSMAEIEIMIADPSHRRQGLGEEALTLMMEYGEQRLGVRMFFAKIHESNAASRHLFRKLGFIEVDYAPAFREYEYRLTVPVADDASRHGHMVYELYNYPDDL